MTNTSRYQEGAFWYLNNKVEWYKSKSKSKCSLAQQCGTCLTNIHEYNKNTNTQTQKRGKKDNCTGNSNIRVIIRWNYSIHEQCIMPLVLGQLIIPISVYVYMYAYICTYKLIRTQASNSVLQCTYICKQIYTYKYVYLYTHLHIYIRANNVLKHTFCSYT